MEENSSYIKLIQETLSGNEEAFNKLANSVQPLAKFYALSIAKDEYIASEATQLSTIKMYQSLSTLKDQNNFEGWFKRIVRNTTLDLLKKENKEINFSAFDQEQDDNFEYNIADENIEYQPELKFAKEEKEQLILSIVSSLPDNQRTPIMMYFFEDMKIKDIALELSIPESTVKTRLTAGKNNIKSKVEQIQKKDGIKLYNISPLGFFIWLMKGYAADIGTAGIAATSLLGVGTTASAKAVSGTILSKIGESLAIKIIAGITATSLVVSGAYVAVNNINKSTNEPIEEIVEEKQIEEVKKYNVTYSFVGKDNISLPSEVMSKLPSSLTDQTKGTTVSAPAIADIKVGNYTYHFDGWDKDKQIISEKDITFTGTWSRTEQIVRHNVYYNFVSINGENMPDSINNQLPATALYNKGQVVTAPNVENVKGWTFLGWDYDSITIQDYDVVFTGTWQKNKETVQTTNTPVETVTTPAEPSTPEVTTPAEPSTPEVTTPATTSQENENKDTYTVQMLFWARYLDGTSVEGANIPSELIDLFPQQYWNQTVPFGQEPILPPMENGYIYNGWQFKIEGGMGNKDTGDRSYWYAWQQIE